MNLTALQASLQAKGYGTDTSAQQIIAINDTYRRVIGMHRWPFLETTVNTLVTVANASTVNLTSVTDLRTDGIDRVFLTIGTDSFPLEYLRPSEFRRKQALYSDAGEPEAWTFSQGALRLWPTPDRVYTVTLDYLKDAPDLAAGSDSPLFDETYHDLLVWGAVADLAFRERDYSGAAWADQQYRMRLAELERAYNVRQRQNARHIQRSDFWNTVGRVWDF